MTLSIHCNLAVIYLCGYTVKLLLMLSYQSLELLRFKRLQTQRSRQLEMAPKLCFDRCENNLATWQGSWCLLSYRNWYLAFKTYTYLGRCLIDGVRLEDWSKMESLIYKQWPVVHLHITLICLLADGTSQNISSSSTWYDVSSFSLLSSFPSISISTHLAFEVPA